MSDSDPILVTGASGYLGRHVCHALCESGLSVRAMTRGKAIDLDLEVVTVSDITDRESLRRAVAGVRTIVHLAACAHDVGSIGTARDAEFQRVNFLGTKTVVEASIEASIEHIVFVSSVRALGSSSERPFRETDPAAPDDAYGLSKRNAEAILKEAALSRAFDATVMRLPLAYGPGMRSNMLRLFHAVARRRPLPFAGVHNRRSFVYVGNAVAALLELSRHPSDGFRVFHVTDGKDISTADLIRAIGDALDEPARLREVPLWLLRGIGRLGDTVGRVTPVPDSTAMSRLTGSLQLDSSLIGEKLGFFPPYSTEQGMGYTADWYKSEGNACPP